ncbi:MAG: hypothetical protein WC869_03925 [Phycisphaerae bacterium]|jgi:hypothetical protein
MTKRQLIDEILTKNNTAHAGFLAQFDDDALREYLGHLRWAKQPRLSGDSRRFEKYFRSLSRPAAPAAVAGDKSTIAATTYVDEPTAQEEMAYQKELEAEAVVADTDASDSTVAQPFAKSESTPHSWLF